MDEELAALRDAQESLRAGRPDEAVRVLDRFTATHAGGALEEERRAARIVAACKADGGDRARADAERFLHERPDAVLGERVRAACRQKAPP
jgi:outer membrane protein assembly factor BamD (BamD/ComL family)